MLNVVVGTGCTSLAYSACALLYSVIMFLKGFRKTLCITTFHCIRKLTGRDLDFRESMQPETTMVNNLKPSVSNLFLSVAIKQASTIHFFVHI